jgi:hypothetical protein
MVEKYTRIINLSNLEKEMKKLKIAFNGSDAISHYMNINECGEVIIEICCDIPLRFETYVFYGVVYYDNIYILYYEHVNGFPQELKCMEVEDIVKEVVTSY